MKVDGLGYVRLGSENVAGRQNHWRRHVIMSIMALIFVLMGLIVVVDLFGWCNVKNIKESLDGERLHWELDYISAKIANCKGEGADLGRKSAWLPWICAVVFPFVMMQVDFTYKTILWAQEGNLNEEQIQPSKDSNLRNRTARNEIQVDYYKGNLEHMLVIILESLCVGGFFWLIAFNHTGPNRNWHGTSTGILFISASFLNIIVWVKLFNYNTVRELNRNHIRIEKGLVGIVFLSQIFVVIAFIIAFLQDPPSESEEAKNNLAIHLEYVVAVIWFSTIVINGIMWVQFRNADNSPLFGEGLQMGLCQYAILCGIGLPVVYGFLNVFVSKT